ARVRRSTGQNNSYVELACGRDRQRVYAPVAWPNQWLQVVVSARVKHCACVVSLHTDAAAGEWTNFDDIEIVPGTVNLPVRGADVSSLEKSEDLGGVYRDDRGRRGDALDILADHGANA